MAEEKNAVFTTDASNDESSKFVDKRRSNTKSDLIEITEDKLENILLKHIQCLGLRKGWIAPLSIFIAFFVSLLTASFNSKLGLSADTWQAIFIICSILSGGWFIVSIIKLFINWKSTKIETLINKIKNVK
jgi:hypothetical protein